MKKLIFLFCFILVTCQLCAQSQAIARKVATSSAKKATKSTVSKSAKEVALTSSERAILHRSIRNQARRNLSKEAGAQGFKSICHYTSAKISKKCLPLHHSDVIKRETLSNVPLNKLARSKGVFTNTMTPVSKDAFILSQNKVIELDNIINAPNSSLKQKRKALLSLNHELSNVSPAQAKMLKSSLSSRSLKSLRGIKIPSSNGHWSDAVKPGNSVWIPDKDFKPLPKTMSNGAIYNNPYNKNWETILKPYGVEGINYVDGIPDLSPFSHCTISVNYEKVLGASGATYTTSKIRYLIQEEAYKEMGKNKVFMKRVKQSGCKTVKEYKEKFNLVCHELPNGEVMLVNREVHDNIPSHLGGIASYKHLMDPSVNNYGKSLKKQNY